MHKFSLVALGLTLSLTGCGSDSESSSTSIKPNPAQPPLSNNSNAFVEPWVSSTVNEAIAKVRLSNLPDEDLCNTGSARKVVETADFKVSFGTEVTNYNNSELEKSARMMQVALDELIFLTGLNKSSDLKITSTDKWVGCYNDSKTGNGEGGIRKFTFSPKSLDITDNQVNDGYVLAKHEIFHTIQAALLNESVLYHHIPRWFQESSAEIFAGKSSNITGNFVQGFMADSSKTPFSVQTYTDENNTNSATSNKYRSEMYKLYMSSLEYLIAKGLTKDRLLTLTKNSYSALGDGSSFAAFNSAMSTMENELSLPTTYSTLRTSTADYNTHVINDWMDKIAYNESYIDDIAPDATNILVMTSDDKTPITTGNINSVQDIYTLPKPISNGSYHIYIETSDDQIYGPLSKTVTNGKLGALNFSGIGVCATPMCTG